MSLDVLDIECIEINIVKELGVYKDGLSVGYCFLPIKNLKPHNLLGVPSINKKPVEAEVTKKNLNFKKF